MLAEVAPRKIMTNVTLQRISVDRILSATEKLNRSKDMIYDFFAPEKTPLNVLCESKITQYFPQNTSAEKPQYFPRKKEMLVTEMGFTKKFYCVSCSSGANVSQRHSARLALRLG